MIYEECEVTPRGAKPNLDACNTTEFFAAIMFGLALGTAVGLSVLSLILVNL